MENDDEKEKKRGSLDGLYSITTIQIVGLIAKLFHPPRDPLRSLARVKRPERLRGKSKATNEGIPIAEDCDAMGTLSYPIGIGDDWKSFHSAPGSQERNK